MIKIIPLGRCPFCGRAMSIEVDTKWAMVMHNQPICMWGKYLTLMVVVPDKAKAVHDEFTRLLDPEGRRF